MPETDPIEGLLASFDWRSLRAAMRAAGRRWTDGRGRRYLPTADKLRECARQLLSRLRACPETPCLRDGGFVARRVGGEWALAFELQTAVAGGPAPEKEED
ncbi:MAG: hypothetical protein KGL39_31010 [Patescibacteria group bacterium]|nr:hypothetical protein [Patescibacteria group bacterium]